MTEYGLQFRFQNDIVNDDITMYCRQTANGRRYYAKKIEFEEHVDGAWMEPMARITPTDAQQIMDGLWQCGLRPSEGTGSAGSLRATQDHLDTLKKILGHSLGIAL